MMSNEWLKRVYIHTKPFVFMIFLQTSYAVSSLIVKSALNKGLNHYTFAVYRNMFAALAVGPFACFIERRVRPKMTISIFVKIMLLGLLEPVIDQNLFFAGMKLTTATFASAMCNIVPAITFVMAWIFRLEMVKMKSLHSQGKIVGTLVTVGGAMIMTLIRGPAIQFPWTNHQMTLHNQTSTNTGIMCSGFAYYMSGVVMQERGPVFVTAFNPLAMVITAILGSSVLAEKLSLGSVLGAVVIMVGLYLVLWGKSNDQNRQNQDQEPSIDQQHKDDMNTQMIKHNVVEPYEKITNQLESV